MNVNERCLTELEHETIILTKLIHRNFNQHRKTKVFSSLHQVHKLMKTLLSINVRHMGTETEHKLRLLQNVTKISSRDFTNCLQHTTYMHQMLLLGIDITVWLRRSAVLLHAQLTQLVFVPLYTMFVALVARCLRSLSTLLFQWEVQLLSLQSSLRHVMTVNQRHRSAASEETLSRCTLTISNPQIHLLLQELRTVYSHHSTTATTTAIPNTMMEDAATAVDMTLCDTNSGNGDSDSSNTHPGIPGEEDISNNPPIDRTKSSSNAPPCQLRHQYQSYDDQMGDEDFGEVVGVGVGVEEGFSVIPDQQSIQPLRPQSGLQPISPSVPHKTKPTSSTKNSNSNGSSNSKKVSNMTESGVNVNINKIKKRKSDNITGEMAVGNGNISSSSNKKKKKKKSKDEIDEIFGDLW